MYCYNERFGVKLGYNYLNFGIDTIADKYHAADITATMHNVFFAAEVQF